MDQKDVRLLDECRNRFKAHGVRAHLPLRDLATGLASGKLGLVMNDLLEDAVILEANDAFYSAFRRRDYLAMEDLWSKQANVCCYHPGWPGIMGREEVLDSWYSLLVLGDTPDINVTQPTIIRNGSTAVVFCTEHLGEVSLIATNTFVIEDGSWRMVHHQAAQLPS